MALNVAELTATLGFETRGVQDAVRQTQQVEQSMAGVTEAATLQQAEIARLRQEHTANTAALQAARAEFDAFGKSEAQVRQEAKLLEAEWAVLASRLNELQTQGQKGIISYDEYSAGIAAILETGKAFTELNKESIGAVNALFKVEGGTKTAAASGRRYESALKSTTKATEVSRTALNGLISALRTGRISTSLIGEAVSGFGQKLLAMAARAASAVTAVGAVTTALLALPFIAVGIGLSLVNSRFGQMAQQMSLIPEEARAVAASLREIEGVSNLDLSRISAGAINRAESFGADNPQAATAATAELAGVAQFLNTTPGDFEATFSQIQRSIETLNFNSLRDLGIDVSELNLAMKELAEQGLSETEKRTQAVILLQDQLAGSVGKAADQANREANTWAGFMGEVRNVIERAFTNETVQKAVSAFIGNLRAAMPFIRGFFRIIGTGFTVILNVANFFLKGFIVVINAIIDALEWVANTALTVAQSIGLFADSEEFDFQRLEADVVSVADGFTDLEDAFEGMDSGAETAQDALDRVEQALSRIREQVSGGQSVVQGIVSYGDALGDLDEFGDPQAIFGVIGAIENLQDLALRGIDLTNFQNELVRLRDAGIITIDQYRTAIEQIAAADEIFQPFAEEADNLRASVEQAEAPMQTAKGQIATTGDAADTARNQIADLGDQIVTTARTAANNPIIATYSISGYADYTLGLSQPGPFGLRVPGTPIAPPTLSNTPELSRPTSGPGSNTLAPPSADNSQVAAESARFASIRKAAEDNNNAAQANQDAVRAFTDAQRSSARSGGGGGGGGSAAQDEGATLDQIRELVNQVNDAISIASRGGTRIGTGGNVVPFEEGSFLDSRGGDLNIQTIQIRGIWDFANPEAKRQILRELEDALEDLKAEAI